MDQDRESPVRVGDVLARKYHVLRVIGTGGMGIVVEALHVDLGHRVALKLMLPATAANDAAVERFSREARAAATLRSDNVVHVSDIGALDSGEPFMVMELLEGEDLGQLLQTRGRLPVDDAVDYVLQVCAGLAEAHATGIIHRDLKPANLFLATRPDTGPVLKIVDFGISKVTAADAAGGLTNTRDLIGSPLYMSPEQLTSSNAVDARTDIWSLGIIVYELLTGAAPFHGDTIPQVCAAVLISAPAPIGDLRPDVPPGLSAIVAKCLEKRAKDRYATVADLAADLAEFAPPRSSLTLERIARLTGGVSRVPSARPRPRSERPRLELVAQTLGETASTWSPTEAGRRSRRGSARAWAAVAIVGLAVATGGAFALRHEGFTVHSLGAAMATLAPVDPPAIARPLATATAAAPSASATVPVASPPPTSPNVPTAPMHATPRRMVSLPRVYAPPPQHPHTPTSSPSVAPSATPSPSASATEDRGPYDDE